MATVQQIREKDVMKQVCDFLDAERIPYFRMNAGDRFGITNGRRWRIKGHAAGTADLLLSPKISRFLPSGHLRLNQITGEAARIPVFLWCELKRPGKSQSPEQVRFELECLQRGHAYICIDDVQELIDWLAERV